jgi:hypothetical protein
MTFRLKGVVLLDFKVTFLVSLDKWIDHILLPLRSVFGFLKFSIIRVLGELLGYWSSCSCFFSPGLGFVAQFAPSLLFTFYLL